MKKPQPKKPIDAFIAAEMFTQDDSVFGDALDSYMESKGYKWDRSVSAYVDDGSLEAEWADRVNDERKGN